MPRPSVRTLRIAFGVSGIASALFWSYQFVKLVLSDGGSGDVGFAQLFLLLAVIGSVLAMHLLVVRAKLVGPLRTSDALWILISLLMLGLEITGVSWLV